MGLERQKSDSSVILGLRTGFLLRLKLQKYETKIKKYESIFTGLL